MAEAGMLGIRRRVGNQRVYDLTERLFPETLLAERPPEHEQRLHRLLSRYRANGLLGATGEYSLWSGTGTDAPHRGRLRAELEERGAIAPVSVEGLRGLRYVPAGSLAVLDQAEAEVAAEMAAEAEVETDDSMSTTTSATLTKSTPTSTSTAVQSITSTSTSAAQSISSSSWVIGRPGGSDPGVAFLAPLDPLAWDRDLLLRLYNFDYRWEVYVPAAKRRWGYYVLPLMYGDRLVGRIEPKLDRKTRTLRIIDCWWEDGFNPVSDAHPGFVPALAHALTAHAAFGDARRVLLPRTARHRALTAALRPLL
jgi:uncharacterized protein YcaQ